MEDKFNTLRGRYLIVYFVIAFVLCVSCIIGLALIGLVMFETNTWSYGVIVLLFLALVLAILAIISLVALYREKGRYHERMFPIEVDNKMKSLKAENQSLNEGIQSLRTDIQSLKTENQSLNEGIQSLRTDIQSLKADIKNLKDATEKPSEEINK